MKRNKEAALTLQLALSQLYERHQKLTPNMVVEAAKDPQSPLHKEFTWDDTVAAAKYRLAQARTLIRSVNVKVNVGTMVVAAPAYIRSPRALPKEQGYTSLERLQGDKKAAKQALLYEAKRARAQMERSRNIALVLGLEGELDIVLNALEVVEQRLIA